MLVLPSLLLLDIWNITFFSPMLINSVKILGPIGIVLFIYDCNKVNKNDFKYKKYIYYIFIYLILNFSCNALLYPWPDTTNTRHFSNLSFLKGIKQLINFLSEIGTGYLLFIKSNNSKKTNKFIIGLFIATTLSAMGIFLDKYMRIDFYHLLTNAFPNINYNRMRGFNYEPRGAAEIISFGLGLISISSMNKKINTLMIILFSLSLPFTLSITGIVIIAFLVPFIIIYNFYFKNWVNFLYLALFLLLFICSSYSIKSGGRTFEMQLSERKFLIEKGIESKSLLKNNQNSKEKKPNTIFKSTNPPSFINRFEVFDGAALNFLAHNPTYLIFGVGLGQNGLASTPYILLKDQIPWSKGSDNPPTMGAVLLLMELGLVGITLLLLVWVKALKTFINKKQFKLMYILLLSSIVWLLQARYFLPIIWFFIFLSQYDYLSEQPECELLKLT